MQNETSLRVLYLYKILMRYSDVDHPLSTNQILQYFDSMYGIRMHRTTVSKYVELLCSSGSAFPAMSSFFYICEYLNVTPQEFFDFNEDHADGINALVNQLDKLDEEQIQTLTAFIKTIVK